MGKKNRQIYISVMPFLIAGLLIFMAENKGKAPKDAEMFPQELI